MKHHIRLSLTLLAASAVMFTFATPASASGAAYCVAQSGTAGENSYVGNCIYPSYQECLTATSQSNGSCVGNVEYDGGARAQYIPSNARRSR